MFNLRSHHFLFAISCFALTTFLIATSAQAQLLRKSFAQAEPKVTEAPPPPAPATNPPAPATPITPAPGISETPAVKPTDGANTPPSAPATGQLLAIKISAVTGNVQVRLGDGQPWQPVKVGMDLNIGAEIRTGLRSVCQFTIDGNHTITLDRLGVIKVLDAIKKDGKIKTDVGMKYGRTQYEVESNAAEHDARVHAPAATLAVRGSFITLEDNDAFGTTAVVDHSENAIYRQRGPQGSVRVVAIELIRGTIEQTPQQAGNTPPTPGQVALRETINDIGTPLAKATELERDLVAMYPILNGAGGGSGGGALPPPGELQGPAKDVLKAIVEPGSFTPGFLNINISFPNGGGNHVFFAVIDPTGAILATDAGIPPGGQTTVRPNGPSQGGAGNNSTVASLHYSDQIAIGGYSIVASREAAGPTTIEFFGDVVRRESAGDPGVTIHTFGGSISAPGPNFNTSFGITAPPPSTP